MRTRILIALAAAIALGGCASILNEKTQKINVTTSTGATIKGTVNGTPFSAPGIVDLTRSKADAVFVTDAPGCNPQTVEPSSVDSKFWINILLGGALGSSTDYSTEKMWKYNDHVVISCKS